MSSFPGAPKVVKGAIVGFDIYNPVASVIIFQYNPEKLTRKLAARVSSQEGGRSEVLRFSGAPSETIDLEVVIDATDQLETGESTATSMGIYPQMSALEMLLYPKSLNVILNTALLAGGVLEVIPPAAPFTLFIWGAKRVVPVRLAGFSLVEDFHDANLNPIRATASLSLQVLSYNDFEVTHPGYGIFLAHQVVKEAMATIGSLSNLGAVVSGDVKLL